eukprot:31023-Pelagococcus_subviridis.AAC.3
MCRPTLPSPVCPPIVRSHFPIVSPCLYPVGVMSRSDCRHFFAVPFPPSRSNSVAGTVNSAMTPGVDAARGAAYRTSSSPRLPPGNSTPRMPPQPTGMGGIANAIPPSSAGGSIFMSRGINFVGMYRRSWRNR